jgi:hypothetical protein
MLAIASTVFSGIPEDFGREQSCGSAAATDAATEALLDLHIEAARHQFDAATIEHAARRLRGKLSHSGARRLRRFTWPSLLATASMLFVVISAVSFFLPGENGTAFAQAQQWLASFRTLQAETTVIAGDSVSRVVAWLDESGDTRVESLGTTTIIKTDADVIYISQPDGRYFAQPITSERIVGSSTEFLDNIRAFRGQADLLPQSREIDGVSAAAYALEIDGAANVLWVDPIVSEIAEDVEQTLRIHAGDSFE